MTTINTLTGHENIDFEKSQKIREKKQFTSFFFNNFTHKNTYKTEPTHISSNLAMDMLLSFKSSAGIVNFDLI